MRSGFSRMMKHEDIGVPYTPFAVLVDKHHGHWSVWGKPWGNFEETTGDRMTVAFFSTRYSPAQLRPRQRRTLSLPDSLW